ncbi:MAG: preprotein translocase subunit YajC [Deltaproteobacteria bacterium]|nr:preprotein translocase subunit YajC [Deltaproteobacteria bacterium]
MLSMVYAAGEAAPQGPGPLAGILPFILIIVIFYLFLILPQQKQRKKHKEFVDSLKRGDKVITSSGIYGTITRIEEKVAYLEIADGVNIRILKNNIATRV